MRQHPKQGVGRGRLPPGHRRQPYLRAGGAGKDPGQRDHRPHRRQEGRREKRGRARQEEADQAEDEAGGHQHGNDRQDEKVGGKGGQRYALEHDREQRENGELRA